MNMVVHKPTIKNYKSNKKMFSKPFKFLLLMFIATVSLTACGDDGASSTSSKNEDSAELPQDSLAEDRYSSSEDVYSSDRQSSDSTLISSCSAQDSSSSAGNDVQSSSSTDESSSTDSSETSSSSDGEDKPGSVTKVAWQYLNPSIKYGEFTDERDGQVYKTVVIGDQTWMAENLNYDYNYGSARSLCYNLTADSCEKYGRLYTWAAAIDSAEIFSAMRTTPFRTAEMGFVRGICPEGWRLPSNYDWRTLSELVGITYTGGSASSAGRGKLLSANAWSVSSNATDVFGLSILPSGYSLGIDSMFYPATTRFHSSTELTTLPSHHYSYITYTVSGYHPMYVNLPMLPKDCGISIRCVKDNKTIPAIIQNQTIVDSSVYDAVANKLTDLRDNKEYRTTTIGDQVWMAENLNYAYNIGSAQSYCMEHDHRYCDKFGRLYLWSAAMDSAAIFSETGKGCGYGTTCGDAASFDAGFKVRGVCPSGWRLPNRKDWNALVKFLGNSGGSKLRSTSGWYVSDDIDGNGTDDFGFNAIPTGHCVNDGSFTLSNYDASYWSSEEEDDDVWASFISLSYNDDEITFPVIGKRIASSVRCIKE